MEGNKVPKPRMRSAADTLTFLLPNGNPDAQRSARKMLDIKGVREVVLTSGKYAFVVKSAVHDGESVRQQLSRMFGPAIMVECHYSFRK